MAVGDIISVMQQVPSTGYLVYQPVGTAEFLIRQFASSDWTGTAGSEVPDIGIVLTDGTNASRVWYGNGAPILLSNAVMLIKNSLYLAIRNNSASGAYIGFMGIQIR